MSDTYTVIYAHVYLFESILACFSPRGALFVGLDDPGDAGDLVKEVELAVEECVGRTVEALNDHSSTKDKQKSLGFAPVSRHREKTFSKCPVHKTFHIKTKLAKKIKQDRPIPQWIKIRYGNIIK